MNSWYSIFYWLKQGVYNKCKPRCVNSLVEAWGGQLKPLLELPAQNFRIMLFAPLLEELSDLGVENISWTAANKLVTRTPLKSELWSFCCAFVSIMLELFARMLTKVLDMWRNPILYTCEPLVQGKTRIHIGSLNYSWHCHLIQAKIMHIV